MKVTVEAAGLCIKAEPGDPREYADTTLMYHARNVLRAQGYDVITRKADRDGHLTDGYYIRDRTHRFAWFDADYQIRSLASEYRARGCVVLTLFGELPE